MSRLSAKVTDLSERLTESETKRYIHLQPLAPLSPFRQQAESGYEATKTKLEEYVDLLSYGRCTHCAYRVEEQLVSVQGQVI